MHNINNIIQNRIVSLAFATLFSAAILFFSPMIFAQMKDSTIKVHGMDCAPCAYGISKRLKGMDGIENATVDLNTGDVTIDVSKSNHLTLREIRKNVVKSGFTPKKATLNMHATVVESDGSKLFKLPSGELFSATNKFGVDLKPGDEVELSGTAEANPKEAPAPIAIEIKDITKVNP
jgi:copper chaperone CopZ